MNETTRDYLHSYSRRKEETGDPVTLKTTDGAITTDAVLWSTDIEFIYLKKNGFLKIFECFVISYRYTKNGLIACKYNKIARNQFFFTMVALPSATLGTKRKKEQKKNVNVRHVFCDLIGFGFCG